jgi:hypothetical protein
MIAVGMERNNCGEWASRRRSGQDVFTCIAVERELLEFHLRHSAVPATSRGVCLPFKTLRRRRTWRGGS